MISKYNWHLAVRILLLVVIVVIGTVLIVRGNYWVLLLLLPLSIFLWWWIVRFYHLPYTELAHFVESVAYRDFSRHFNENKGAAPKRELYRQLNRLSRMFQQVSREKETQYRYLEKMLSLIDTGMLAYEMDSGTVSWMNDTWKQMLLLPHLKQLHGLEKRNEKLYREISELPAGENRIVRLQVEQDTFKVMLTATIFITEGKRYKLVACKNISDALDATEAKAWQQLLSVLTHEIMNSIAPISSLADTLKKQVREVSMETVGQEDLELGIETIQKRSEGLLRFARTYSRLNQRTRLQMEEVSVFTVLEGVCQLMAPTLEQKQIDWQLILKDPTLKIEADRNLLEQVLINLLMNAMQAVKSEPQARIVLSAYRSTQGRTIIKVADNGPGIPEALWEKIFIPFFSSRKNGTGIGLSLCKQIMLLHKGNIQVQSVTGQGTAFLLYF